MKQPIEWRKRCLEHHEATLAIFRRQAFDAIAAYRRRKAVIRVFKAQIELAEKRGLSEFDADKLG